jgi:hypothetical protein
MPKKHDTLPLPLLNKSELIITMLPKLKQDYANDNYWKIDEQEGSRKITIRIYVERI